MPNININSGLVRLTINDDPNRVISFNPESLTFAERVYTLISDYEEVEKEYRLRAVELDQHGANITEGMALIREVCEDMKSRIDSVFGPGTSAAAFGDDITITMFEQFFDGVMPFIEKARKGKTNKYTAGTKGKRPGVLKK